MESFKLFADSRCVNAENPLWNEAEQMLYWKGSKPGEIFRKALTGDSTDFERLFLPVGLIGGFAFMQDGGLLIFAQSGKVWQWRDGRDPVPVAELPGADEQTYFNDLIADPEGRVYCGVLAHDFFNRDARGKYGALWRFDPDSSLHCLEAETGACPNGMGLSPDLRYFYFAVTDQKTIYRYDYDRSNGHLSNRIPLIKAANCDGMTVDAEGSLWVAPWSGPLTRYSQDGEKLLEYPLPPGVRAASSVTFGGPDYQTIFVTTADSSNNADKIGFYGGGVLSMKQNIAGMKEYPAFDEN
jgi:D-xylonolactonase